MNSNYISTQSLYDSGAHLSHARTYSHKYIKREPDGKGGYRYYYKTDVSLGRNDNINSYRRYDKNYDGPYMPSNKAVAQVTHTTPHTGEQRTHDVGVIKYGPGAMIDSHGKTPNDRLMTPKQFREASKASEIYNEGQSQNAKDYQSNKSKKKSIGDYAKQAIDTISTAAGSAYDKGKNFLKNLFK